MSFIVEQFQTVRFIQMMSLTFGLFTQVSGSGPLGPLVWTLRRKPNITGATVPPAVIFRIVDYRL